MPPSVIVAASSLREYFEEAVSLALRQHEFTPTVPTVDYLVDLLCERAIAADQEERALAVVLAEARRAPPLEALPGLKLVGDESLYLAGYRSESLRRVDLDPEYFVVLGVDAYNQLSGTLRTLGGESRLVVVYDELGTEFSRFVQVLGQVRGQEPCPPEQDIAECYAEWLRTGSETAARRLRAAGMLVVRRPERE